MNQRLTFGENQIDPGSEPAALFLLQSEQTIRDGVDSQLFTRLDVEHLRMDQRLAVTQGLVQYAFSQPDVTTNDMAAVRFAIESGNPNLVPRKYDYLAQAIGSVVSDYRTKSSLDKWIGTYAADAVRYQKTIEDQRKKQLEQEQALAAFDIRSRTPEANAAALSFAARSGRDDVEYQPATIAEQAIAFYGQGIEEARNLVAGDASDELVTAFEKANTGRFTAFAQGLMVTAVDGLTNDQANALDGAITTRNPKMAPERSRAALAAVIEMERQTGVDLLSEFGSFVSEWRDGGAKAIELQNKTKALGEAALIDPTVNAIATASVSDANELSNEAFAALGKIANLDEQTREGYRNRINTNLAKAKINSIFGQYVSADDLPLIKGLFDGRTDIDLFDTIGGPIQEARQLAEAAGSTPEVRSHLRSVAESYSQELRAREKFQEELVREVNVTSLGLGDPTSAKDQSIVENYLNQTYFSEGGSFSELLANPASLANPSFQDALTKIKNMRVLPTSLKSAFEGVTQGDFGPNTQVILSHWANVRTRLYNGQDLPSPAAQSLSADERASLDYLLDASTILGTQMLPQIFKAKTDLERGGNFETKVKDFYGATPFEFVSQLTNFELLTDEMQNGLVGAATTLYSLSTIQGLSAKQIRQRLQKVVNETFQDGEGIVFDRGNSDYTIAPISLAAPGREGLFRDYVMEVVDSAFPDNSYVLGIDEEGDSKLFLRPISRPSQGVYAYQVMEYRPIEEGGSRGLVAKDNYVFVSNNDPRFRTKLQFAINGENATADFEASKRRVIPVKPTFGGGDAMQALEMLEPTLQ